MKIIISSIFTLFLTTRWCAQAQNILSYGNSTVSKQEFLRAFLKNNTDKQPPAQAYRDYLELYTRFKLKVKAAYDLKMDTLPNQKAELADFRNQIAATYLSDESSFQNLVHEAFIRSQKDIHLAHIFIAFDKDAESSDTTGAWKQTSSIYNSLLKGADFSQLATLHSSDPSAKYNHGDIGFVTVFTLPYALENLGYTTPVGKFSKPYRSRVGYHIFKNLGERKAVGKMKAAQILFAFLPDTSSRTKSLVKQKADSVYNALTQGASFNQMVDRFSNDINASATHGELPEFGVGSFDPQIESAVFALETNGAITRPLPTPAGYYIIKRWKLLPVNDDLQNDSAMTALRQLVRNDARMEVAKKALLQKIYRSTALKKTPFSTQAVLTYAESSFNSKKTASSAMINGNTIIYSFPREKVVVDDFIKYLQTRRDIQNGKIAQSVLQQFEENRVQEYYRNHLDEYNAEFAAQLKEFKEGNLLFEIMQHDIWDKASADSLGLRSFYEKNKSKYWWDVSVDVIIFNSPDSTAIFELKDKLEKNPPAWRTIMTAYENKVQADSGRFDLSQLPLQQQNAAAGLLTAPVKISGDNSFSFMHIIKLYPEKQLRDFEDAKGFVLNDYQDYLENKWITLLKKKYPVKVNEAVFQSLLKSH